MIRNISTVLAIIATTTPVVAFADDVPIEIVATGVTRDSSGGCTIALALKNTYPETLKVSADAYMITPDGTTLADGRVSFPPAIPQGRSLAELRFYSHKIAGRVCPLEYIVNVTPRNCFITGTDSALKDQYCKATWTFTVGRRKEPSQ